jgi:hypothetical protein
MTVENMLTYFQSLLELSWDEFKIREKPDTDIILKMINLANDRYIKEKYLIGPTIDQTILFLQKNPGDLQKMIKRQSGLGLAAFPTRSDRILVSLPTDYLHYIRSDSKITRTTVNPVTSIWTPNMEATYEEIRRITRGPFNEEIIIKEPIVVFEQDNKMLVYFDSYTSISDIEVTYLRKPKDLVLEVTDSTTQTNESELAEYTNKEVLRLAVEMFIVEYKFRLSSGQEAQKPKE